jgi:RNA polymerase sigma-70 factor (ECF subfamily)
VRVEPAGWEQDEVAAFCRGMSSRLVRTLTAATGDPGLAEEIAQETLARAWERWSQVRLMEAPDAWCFRVALNLTRSQFRRRAAARRAAARLPSVSSSQDAECSDKDLLDALRRMPAQHRAVLALRYLADLSVESTAEVLRIPVGTVKSNASRALVALREDLERQAIRDKEQGS